MAGGFEEEEDDAGDQALGPAPSLASLKYEQMNFNECVKVQEKNVFEGKKEI